MGHPAGHASLVLDMLVWSPGEGTAGHPIWGLLGQSSVPVFGNQALDRQEVGGEKKAWDTHQLEEGLEGWLWGRQEENRLGGGGKGAVVLSDKSSGSVPPTMEDWGQKLDWRRFRR